MKALASLILFAGFAAYGATALDEAQRLYDATNYSAAADKLQGAADAASLRLLGQIYMQMNDLKKASETLEKAVEADPKSSQGYLFLGRAYGLRAQSAGISAASLAIKTRENFEKAYSLDPHNWDAAGDLFEFYLQAPGFMGGGLDKAAKLAEAIAAHDPSEGAVDRGLIAEHHKDYPAAEQQFRSAIQLASPASQATRHVDLAQFFARRDRYAESDAEFAQAMQASPNTPKIIYARAATLVRTNRNLPEARDLLTKYLALKLTPDDPSRPAAEKLLRKASGS
jgi:tetratricopeptide (TPR) repeat protein